MGVGAMSMRKMTDAPAHSFAACTVSNSTVQRRFAGLFIGVGGNVALKNELDPEAVTFKNVPSGSILAVGGDLVMSTGTTATDIVLLFND
jgi:hypothetical protein